MAPDPWQVVLDNKGLIGKAMKMMHVAPADRDELESHLLETMWRCAIRFDPSRGFRFSTYAIRSMTSRINRWRQIRNRNVTRFFQQPASVAGTPFAEAVAPDDGERRAEEDREHVATLLARLPPKDRRLIEDRFWRGMKLRELGPKYGVSHECARKRLELSLERMRR